MKQILKEWRKFLNEDSSYFGNSFVNYKTLVENGGDPLWSAYRAKLKEIGRGSTRVVFELPDNNDFVLKIINKEEISKVPGEDPNKEGIIDRHGFTIQNKRNANMYEADLKIQIENPILFPKSTEHAEDYSWILVEKVEQLTKEEFRAALGLPSDTSAMTILALSGMIIEAWQNKENKSHYSHQYVAESSELYSFDDIEQNIGEDETTKMINMPNIDKQSQNSSTYTNKIKENIKSILRNVQAVRILALMAKHDIQATEFKASNLGISKLNGGKIVMLDTSMWDDRK